MSDSLNRRGFLLTTMAGAGLAALAPGTVRAIEPFSGAERAQRTNEMRRDQRGNGMCRFSARPHWTCEMGLESLSNQTYFPVSRNLFKRTDSRGGLVGGFARRNTIC